MSNFGINVFDFGAKGDGVTDDTAAIQAAINYAAERGGGKILFPYTKGGYRIASPAIEEYNGKPLRAQLMIPPGNANIMLEGEMPCKMLNAYILRGGKVLFMSDALLKDGVFQIDCGAEYISAPKFDNDYIFTEDEFQRLFNNEKSLSANINSVQSIANFECKYQMDKMLNKRK